MNSTTAEAASVHLTKHQGLGNDFLVAVDPWRPLVADDAARWCDRHRGIGADGLIMLRSPGGGAASETPWVMTLWNADGSRAEISGNGLRCAAQALAMQLRQPGSCSFVVATDAGLRRLDLEPTDDADVVLVRVDMGSAKPGPPDSARWAALGVAVGKQRGIDMGNPHLVALVDDVGAHDIGTIGPAVEADYPDGLNVHLIQIDGPSQLTLRVWERGAGVTEACGSGACAAASAAEAWGLVDQPVEVRMPGGSVVVEIDHDNVFLTGPAAFIGSAVVRG